MLGRSLLVALVMGALAVPAAAQTGDATFGPVLIIDRIDVVGNTTTATHLIERALPIEVGDVLRAGDPRMVSAPFKVLALGFFRDVDISLDRGTERGHVVVKVVVVERGTIILERLFFGSSQSTPWWAGIDATERNLFGTGVGVGAGLVFAGQGDIAGASGQKAFQLRLRKESVAGTTLGAFGEVHHVDASEPFRVSGDLSDTDPDLFDAFDYQRTGGRAGVELRLTPLSVLRFSGRLDLVEADLPAAPTRERPDGSVEPVDLALVPGDSRVATLSVGFDRDTRSDPVLTTGGDRLMLHAEIGGSWLGSNYDHGAALASYQRWWAVGSIRHVVSLHLTGGIILGDAPLFDRIHVGDLNRMVTPRALGLVMSTAPSLDLFGNASDELIYGEVGGAVEVQYSYRLFRDRFKVYGGDLFVGAGVWGLAERADLDVRDRPLADALPIDLMLDIGLRLDTEIGIFELTLANALGRVPL